MSNRTFYEYCKRQMSGVYTMKNKIKIKICMQLWKLQNYTQIKFKLKNLVITFTGNISSYK